MLRSVRRSLRILLATLALISAFMVAAKAVSYRQATSTASLLVNGVQYEVALADSISRRAATLSASLSSTSDSLQRVAIRRGVVALEIEYMDRLHADFGETDILQERWIRSHALAERYAILAAARRRSGFGWTSLFVIATVIVILLPGARRNEDTAGTQRTGGDDRRRWFKPAAGQYTKLGFILALLAVIGGLADLPAKLGRLLIRGEPPLTVTNLMAFQPTMSVARPRPRWGYGGFDWRAMYEVTNVSAEPQAVRAFTVTFPTLARDTVLRTTAVAPGGSIAVFADYETLLKAAGEGLSLAQIGKPTTLPIGLAPGEKKYVGFDLSLELLADGRPVYFSTDTTAYQTLMRLFGFLPTGRGSLSCQPMLLNTSITLGDGQNVQLTVPTLLSVPGCSMAAALLDIVAADTLQKLFDEKRALLNALLQTYDSILHADTSRARP